jgi:hypothetical protein
MNIEITRSAGWDEESTLSYCRQTMVIMKNGEPYKEPINPNPPAPIQRVQKVDEDGMPITSLKDLRRTLQSGNVTNEIPKNTNYDPDAIDPNSFFNSGLNTLGNQLSKI